MGTAEVQGALWLGLSVAVAGQVGWSVAAAHRAGASRRMMVTTASVNVLLGLMIVVAVRLALVAIFKDSAYALDWLNLLILAGATTALLVWKLNATWIVLIAGVVGWAASLVRL